MNSSDKPRTPFAGANVREPSSLDAPPHQDPYRALDELMAVAEALSPEWPQRPPFSGTERMLL